MFADDTKEAHVQGRDLWISSTNDTENVKILDVGNLVQGCQCFIEYLDWSGIEIADY